MALQSILKRLIRRSGWDVSRYRAQDLYGLANHRYSTVLDVGAHEGSFAAQVRGQQPDAAIVCFEALPSLASSLRKRFENDSRTTVVEAAISDVIGEATFQHNRAADATSSLKRFSDGPNRLKGLDIEDVSVTLLTLDSALDGFELGKSVFLKCDVQGAELEVLTGATATLEAVDLVLIEVNFAEFYDGQSRFLDIVNSLSDAGLGFAGLAEQFHLPGLRRPAFADALFLRFGHEEMAWGR